MAKGEFSCRDLQPKNGKASYLPIYGEKRPERYMALSEVDPKCPFLIQHEGQSVFDFEKAWAKACSLSRNFRNTVSRPPQDRSNEHDRSRTTEKERWRSAATRRAPCSIVITIVRENG
jgi:hypothetical protein